MRALRILFVTLGTLVVTQFTHALGHTKSATQQQQIDSFDTEQAATRAVERHDWQGAVREYTKLIELLPEVNRQNATQYKCPRATAYTKLGQLENASRDLSFEVDPIASESSTASRIPTICLLARAEFEVKKRNLDRAAYYYRLMFRDDRNDEVAERALQRLKTCPLQAFRVRGIAAKNWRALQKAISPNSSISDTDDNNPFKVKACKPLCRIPTEGAAVRPNPAGGFYAFPDLLPQKASRCGGTNPQDTPSYLEDVFAFTMALGTCNDGPNGPCPLACFEPVGPKDAGWEVRTVAPDPNQADSILVVDQRNSAAGPGAPPGHDAYKLTLTSDGFLGANAPFCAKIPVIDSHANASHVIPAPAATQLHKASVRHSFIARKLRRWFSGPKNRWN